MPPEVAEAAEDLRSQLASAMAAQEKPEPEAKAEEPKKEEPKAEASAEEPKAEEVKPEAEAETEKSEVKAEEPVEEKAETETEKEPAADKLEAPQNWSKRDKEMLARAKEADPQIAQWMLDRDKAFQADYTKKTQAIAQLKKDYEPVDQLFAPHREVMKSKNLSPSGLVEAWMNVEKQLAGGEQAAINVVRGIISGYNIPVDKLAASLGVKASEIETGEKPAAPQGDKQAAIPPELQARLDALEGRFKQVDQQQLTAAQRAAQEAEVRAQGAIEEFKGETDGRGNLLHPFFDDVEADMLAIVQGLKASNKQVPPLKDLYDRAVYANPETRAKLLTAQKQQEELKRTQAAKEKAANARKAASSVTGSPSGPGMASQARQSERSLRAELDAAFQDNAA